MTITYTTIPMCNINTFVEFTDMARELSDRFHIPWSKKQVIPLLMEAVVNQHDLTQPIEINQTHLSTA